MSNEHEAPRKTVCIVGCSESKDLTPFHRTDCEFWGVNNLFFSMPDKPWTRWFEIHEITQEDGVWLRRGKPDFRGTPVGTYLEQMGKAFANVPVYMQKLPNALVPSAVLYPLPKIVEAFGNYFTNSISWQIALAIAEGFEEIRIYGVDMAVDTEYFHQRPSCEYFLGLAAGRGIRIWIPDSCDLLKARFLYAFDEPKSRPYEEKFRAVKAQLEKKEQRTIQEIQALEQQMRFKQKQLDQYIGAKIGNEEQYKIWKCVDGA